MKKIASFLAVAIALIGAAPGASGQVAMRWQAPDSRIRIDFAAVGKTTKMKLLDDGLAMEFPLEFLMVKHNKVVIEAVLPEPGEFEIKQANPLALVELKQVRVQGKLGLAEVHSKIAVMDRNGAQARVRQNLKRIRDPIEKEVRQEASKLTVDQLVQGLGDRKIPRPLAGPEQDAAEVVRNRYIEVLTQERMIGPLRAELQEIARQKPAWLPSKRQKQWESDPRAVLDDYSMVAEWQVIDEYLHEIGLGVPSNTPEYRAKLESRLFSVWTVLSGKYGDQAAAAAKGGEAAEAFRQLRETIERGLGPEDFRRLRDAVEVKLHCHFLSKTDPRDPNAQWFNGQRIACRAPGVAAIRVRGHLDPGEHDRVDWWILEQYDPSMAIHVDQADQVALMGPFAGAEAAPLRVAARGEKPVDYTLEFRSTAGPSATREVVLYESPAAVDAEFPF